MSSGRVSEFYIKSLEFGILPPGGCKPGSNMAARFTGSNGQRRLINSSLSEAPINPRLWSERLPAVDLSGLLSKLAICNCLHIPYFDYVECIRVDGTPRPK